VKGALEGGFHVSTGEIGNLEKLREEAIAGDEVG
jgi:hypothetical protein